MNSLIKVGITLAVIAASQAQEVVVDINSLIEPDIAAKEYALMQELGFSTSKWLARSQFGLYAITQGIPVTPSSIEEHFFAHLHAADRTPCETPVPFQQIKLLPPLMCRWLVSRESSSVIHSFNEHLDQQPLSEEQKKFYRAVALIAFNAQKYAQTSTINTSVYNFITRCRSADHPVYLIGNTNGECFDALQKRFSAELALFDKSHRYLSCQDGLLKPARAFYKAFEEHCAVSPDRSIVCLEGEATQAHMPASASYLGSCICVATQPEDLQSYLEQPHSR